MTPDLDPVGGLIREAAEREVLPRFQRLQAGDVEEKGPGDLVTVADRAAELFLTPALCSLVPGSVVVGEEAVSADRTILDALHGTAPVWTVDPVDGTANFVAGRAEFAMMVALVRLGEVCAAWIHDPIRNVTARGELGSGSWIGGRRIRLGPAPELGEMRVSLVGKARRRLEQSGLSLRAVYEGRCCGQDYLAMLEGRLDAALYTKLSPWDHAPGSLLHREAGGTAALLPDQSPYSPADWTPRPFLMTPDDASWRRLATLLAPE